MTVSSGKALNEIMPQQHFKWKVPSWNAVEHIGTVHESSIGSMLDTAAYIESPSSLEQVLRYMAHVGKSTDNIDRFNALLAEMGHDLRLESD